MSPPVPTIDRTASSASSPPLRIGQANNTEGTVALTEPTSNPFSAEVVAAVTRHMNVDHAEDSVVICRALGGQPDATAATMTGLDAEGIAFDVVTPTGPASARIPWTEPVTERAQIRAEVAAMYHRACDQLGIAPAAGEHAQGAS